MNPAQKLVKNSLLSLFALAALSLASDPALAAKVGEPAPPFSAQDSKGKPVNLDDFKGKYVVLEWTNKDCPYVRKHYESKNMQTLQKRWTGKGVRWLSVLSSAPGQQGNLTPQEANRNAEAVGAAPTALLMDPKGEMGNHYGAKTTPHIFVIDPKGTLIYDGAIDDKSTTDKEDVATAKNYVTAALEESMAGKAVSVPTTRPYGCSVKYKN